MIDFLIYLAPAVLLFIAAILIYVLISEINKSRSPHSVKHKIPSSQRKSSQSAQTLPNPDLQRQLVRLLNGDSSAATRLIQNTKKKYPGKPQQWYLEKVISDLERDRR